MPTNSEPEHEPNCHYDTKPQDRQGGTVDRLPVSSLRFSSVPSEKTAKVSKSGHCCFIFVSFIQ